MVVDVEELPAAELAESVHAEGPAFLPGPVRDLVELAMPGRPAAERGEVLARLAELRATAAA